MWEPPGGRGRPTWLDRGRWLGMSPGRPFIGRIKVRRIGRIGRLRVRSWR
ncbi:MAG: hypothetical protein QXY01_07525 [Candidatus Bathyarchaeia archaeon]